MELTKLVLENKTMSDDNPKKTITQKFERPNTRKIRAPRIGLSRRIPSFKYMNKRKMPKKAFRVQQPHRTNKNNQLEQPEKKSNDEEHTVKLFGFTLMNGTKVSEIKVKQSSVCPEHAK